MPLTTIITNSNIEPMKNSTRIKDRIIECSSNGELSYTDELHILNHLINKFKPLSLSEYARKENISPNGAKCRIAAGKVMYINMIGKTFIIE